MAANRVHTEISYRFLKKTAITFILFIFLLNQILPPAVSSVAVNPGADNDNRYSLDPTVTAEQAAEKQLQNGAPSNEPSETTQDFLQNNHSLNAVNEEQGEMADAKPSDEKNPAPDTAENQKDPHYSETNDAAILQPENFAAAQPSLNNSLQQAFDHLLKKISDRANQTAKLAIEAVTGVVKFTEDQLAYLVRRAQQASVEVAMTVWDGILTLISSGQRESVSATSEVASQLDDKKLTPILAHIQTTGDTQPSLRDKEVAARRDTTDAVFSTDDHGKLSGVSYTGQAITPDDTIKTFVQQVNDALDPAQKNWQGLSEWIHKAEFGPLKDYLSDPPTVLPGFPQLGFFLDYFLEAIGNGYRSVV